MMKRIIYIVPLGQIDPVILEGIRNGASLAFGFPVEILPVTTNPNYAYEPRRQQYYSTKILEELIKIFPSDTEKIIGVTEVDLATPVLTFVFGEAQLRGTTAVISLARLRQEFYQLLPNHKLLLCRAVKEAIHELGHTFGLLHCEDCECVMYFSSNITGIDCKYLNFCSNCLAVLYKSH